VTLAVDHPAARFSGPATLERPVRRIVSLLPSATEIVCALGLADRLVGVTHECDFPPDAIEGLPRLTADRLPESDRTSSAAIDSAVRAALADGHGLYSLDDGRLRDLGPDLILTQELCRVCAVSYGTVLSAARATGGGDAPLILSLEPTSLASVLETIGLVSELCGVAERGSALVASLQRRLAPIRSMPGRPRVAVVEWLDPLFAPGHWVPDQVAAAGGDAVFGTPGERSREATWETLAATRPDAVVLALCGFDLPRTLDEWAAFEAPAPLRTTPAGADAQLWAIDGSAYVSRPGPRLVDGVEILAGILRGASDTRAVRLRASVSSLRRPT
jgi:iron complex transport system substrate-binding protein